MNGEQCKLFPGSKATVWHTYGWQSLMGKVVKQVKRKKVISDIMMQGFFLFIVVHN